ncbi:MAG: hypothetical protein F6K11_32665 [Leptolyngbya sp. SIO3F4]|nr:hypothetical protein [Leptolyngbya sp. SIO3F4]
MGQLLSGWVFLIQESLIYGELHQRIYEDVLHRLQRKGTLHNQATAISF